MGLPFLFRAVKLKDGPAGCQHSLPFDFTGKCVYFLSRQKELYTAWKTMPAMSLFTSLWFVLSKKYRAFIGSPLFLGASLLPSILQCLLSEQQGRRSFFLHVIR